MILDRFSINDLFMDAFEAILIMNRLNIQSVCSLFQAQMKLGLQRSDGRPLDDTLIDNMST